MESCAATEVQVLEILNGLKMAYEGWMGSCYQCLRNCEGQQEWPFNQCRKRRKTNP